MESNVLKFKPGTKAAQLADKDVLVDIVTITPACAARWLRDNKTNRSVRPTHVHFLARQMTLRRWMLTGETIVIADTEDVLDGQHRLLACVESGKPFKSLVVYGISKEAFKAMGQGRPRTSGDVVKLNYPELGTQAAKEIGSAAYWANYVAKGITTHAATRKLSNEETLLYLKDNPAVFRCYEIVSHYPKDQRYMPVASTTALLHLFGNKSWEQASDFMLRFCTGEALKRSEPIWTARSIFAADERKIVGRMMTKEKMWILIKAWNAYRAGKKSVSTKALRRGRDEKAPVVK